ncbi:HAD-IIIA family hydrolase [Mumia sp. zg.B21]|uniref:HAD-IIIA family hydrolase n=1 Tax=Mumia sp. zg.B21 TaxID=2855447 RepID=UPI0027E3A9E2|nr:HAD-IIIA family hydrolase [Mumia sp. zg.B21]
MSAVRQPVVDTTVVVPTVGRPSLARVLATFLAPPRPGVAAVVVVDDRPADDDRPLQEVVAALPPDGRRPWLSVVRSYGRGPAAARNLGAAEARTTWISFLDDDVEPEAAWTARLVEDLDGLAPDVAGTQGRVEVPLPTDRRPDDFARATAGLATARWITADMTYRRTAFVAVGGFDERFPRAYREDADLALRMRVNGAQLVRGARTVVHPVRAERAGVSVRAQRGNADDRLMRALHGPRWRTLAEAPPGRLVRHVAITVLGAGGALALAAGRRRTAVAALAGWAAGTSELFLARWLPGSRSRAETVRMLWTSAVIPPTASWHALRGAVLHRRVEAWPERRWLVLFDRDGTLVHDVPYNGDPEKVEPVEGAAEALQRLRGAGAYVGIITNQSGVGRGFLEREQVDAVNRRVEQLLGPFDVEKICPHAPEDGCACRKPAPRMVLEACAALGVPVERCVVIGDIGADVEAARAAGARGIMVPNDVTRPEEVAAAAFVRPDLRSAVDEVLKWVAQVR